jgi:hypothetical protein
MAKPRSVRGTLSYSTIRSKWAHKPKSGNTTMSFDCHVHRQIRRFGLGANCATSVSLANSELGTSGRVKPKFRPIRSESCTGHIKTVLLTAWGVSTSLYTVYSMQAGTMSLTRSSLTACLAHHVSQPTAIALQRPLCLYIRFF